MKPTLTTKQAAWLLGIHPHNLHRWATAHGCTPLRHQRIGRSTHTIWSTQDLTNATRN